mmetsp:Transcript_33036/g.60901  ORF Transcript_33036/g.60901 Transcript_33036/m.60901 type:complete len:129 (+) Transcript_33036:488-874(+)|eukprot:CAMPEP_0197465738 /NCGR_PEP_ID=MMETSP1175-20131217/64693_1 /TAXON_ID=1003142 /ORGANISM="Triceratium dubium, Strain CCMP147" /LENGTH=128 /DNA_ID=CAMNT_0043001757 /DNA_START=1394 /DNA_END=1780 /DNA_ORIENTATION=-
MARTSLSEASRNASHDRRVSSCAPPAPVVSSGRNDAAAASSFAAAAAPAFVLVFLVSFVAAAVDSTIAATSNATEAKALQGRSREDDGDDAARLEVAAGRQCRLSLSAAERFLMATTNAALPVMGSYL